MYAQLKVNECVQCCVGYINIMKICGLWIKDHKKMQEVTRHVIIGGVKKRERGDL